MNRKLRMEELQRLDSQAFAEADKIPVTVMLDNVRSLSNVGSVFRTCDAFRVQELILGGITGTPPHREIQKTALGATETVKWRHAAVLLDELHELRRAGRRIFAVEQCADTVLPHTAIRSNDPIVVVFGNEVEGVQQAIVDACDGVIEIPQAGTKQSLNVTVAAGIVLWEAYKAFTMGVAED